MDNLKARFGRAVKTWPALLLAAGMAMVLTISPARAADPALKILLKKGIITQQEYDEAIKEAEQPPAAPVEAKPMTQAKEDAGVPSEKSASAQDSTVDLGKGIRFGYDRGLYTQFKDKFQLKIRIRLQFRYTESSVNSAYGAVGDTKNYPTISGTAITARKLQEDVSEFDVRRVRLVFEGFAFNPETTYLCNFGTTPMARPRSRRRHVPPRSSMMRTSTSSRFPWRIFASGSTARFSGGK